MKSRSNSNRLDRLNSEFQKEISVIISQKLKNPLIVAMVSVMKVDVAPDLSHAKVYLSVYAKDKDQQDLTFNEIKKDAKKIRFELGHSMKVRTVPELHFIQDESMEYSAKISSLLNKIGDKNWT